MKGKAESLDFKIGFWLDAQTIGDDRRNRE
jgi:hypothetical protein